MKTGLHWLKAIHDGKPDIEYQIAVEHKKGIKRAIGLHSARP